VSSTIHRRTVLAGAVGALAAGAVASPARAGAAVATAFELPGDRVYPEGIAVDPRTGVVYVGSYADGTIYRALPGRRTAEVLLPPGRTGGTPSTGCGWTRRGGCG
jgi:Cu-Zn family superoxide dismutase